LKEDFIYVLDYLFLLIFVPGLTQDVSYCRQPSTCQICKYR